ncbi:MAG: hypothetical protein II835_00145 [Fibrobacter sp.]|nr:hypothetical protein [Fibrobacter sp.]
MIKSYKRDIFDVLDLLRQRDPAWKHAKMLPKFKVLYQGWRVYEMRHKIHSHYFYTSSWKRTWLPASDWNRFRDYAMQ